MYIKYKNLTYSYLKRNEEILTYIIEKTDETFLKDDDIYYKAIDYNDKNIQDIFDVEFYITWDSKLPKVQTKWRILNTGYYMRDGKVYISHEGQLPGWKMEEQYICSLLLDMNEIEGYSIKYTYNVKDGQRLETPLVIEENVERKEFEDTFVKYMEENI